MRKCRFCAEDIQDAAITCKHCGRDLIPGRSSAKPVTVTGIDPFAAYTTPIQGKAAGTITVIGYLGIGLGVLIVLVGLVALTSGRDGGQAGFLLGVTGVCVSVASYLWVRR